MTSVGVTGASGHLGSMLVPFLLERGYTVTPIGRTMPHDLDVDVVMHLAAPNWRDDAAMDDFYRFHEQVVRWREVSGGRVIQTGSWWQYAGDGHTPELYYSRIKGIQERVFDVSLVPFSIYGTSVRAGRGFIPHLVAAVRAGRASMEASRQLRDWIHARDVCEALRACLSAPDGIYEARTGIQYSPAELARTVGMPTTEHVDDPPCSPVYRHDLPPGFVPRVDVLTHIRLSLSKGAAA